MSFYERECNENILNLSYKSNGPGSDYKNVTPLKYR